MWVWSKNCVDSRWVHVIPMIFGYFIVLMLLWVFPKRKKSDAAKSQSLSITFTPRTADVAPIKMCSSTTSQVSKPQLQIHIQSHYGTDTKIMAALTDLLVVAAQWHPSAAHKPQHNEWYLYDMMDLPSMHQISICLSINPSIQTYNHPSAAATPMDRFLRQVHWLDQVGFGQQEKC